MNQIFAFTADNGDKVTLSHVVPGGDLFLTYDDGDTVRTMTLSDVVGLSHALTGWLGDESEPTRYLVKVRRALEVGLNQQMARDAITRMQNEGILFRERGDASDLTTALEDKRKIIQQVIQDRDELRAERDELLAYRTETQPRISELVQRAEELTDKAARLDAQSKVLQDRITEGESIPPEQGQRAAALAAAQEAAKNLTSSGPMTKQGQTTRQPDVLSLAHFILTGDRDYVTHDGEYVERQSDHLPTIHVRPLGPAVDDLEFGPTEGNNDDER